MQDAHGDGVAQAPHDQNAAYRAVVSDLASLVEHVQNSLRLIEQTIAREISPETSPGGSESSTNVLVLDDVSPRYIEGCRRSASLRRQSWHRPALPPGLATAFRPAPSSTLF